MLYKLYKNYVYKFKHKANKLYIKFSYHEIIFLFKCNLNYLLFIWHIVILP